MNKSKLIQYIIMGVILIVSLFFILKQVNKTFTESKLTLINSIVTDLTNSNNQLEEVKCKLEKEVKELKETSITREVYWDTIYVDLLKMDTINFQDTLYIRDTLNQNIFKGSQARRNTGLLSQPEIIKQYIEKYKPQWGVITLKDSSNYFTNLEVKVGWPYGKQEVSYYNKYKKKNFSKYIGIGIEEKSHLLFTFNIYYKKIGIGIILKQEGNHVTKATTINYGF